jgi:hypothetical protein
MNKYELREYRRKHYNMRCEDYASNNCSHCRTGVWPCEYIKLLDYVESLLSKLREVSPVWDEE